MPPIHIAGTAMAATASDGNAKRDGNDGRQPTSVPANAAPAATAPNSAHALSANCAASRTSRPWIHDTPARRVTSQPPTAMVLTMPTAQAAFREGRSNAHKPAASCAAAITMKRRASVGCSACTPVAAACTAPAPIELSAAAVRPGRRVEGEFTGVGSTAVSVGVGLQPGSLTPESAQHGLGQFAAADQ